MHVLVAAHDFYPDPGAGGTGRYVYETARRLVDRGHRVSVVTRRRGDVPRRGTVEGIRVARYDCSIAEEWAGSIAGQLPRAVRAVATAIDDLTGGRPDLFSVQGHVTGLLADRAVDNDVPRVATFHSPWPTEYRIRTRESELAPWRRALNVELRLLVERRLLSRCDRVVTLSEYMGEECRRVYGLPADADHAVIPGGVDVERFRPDVGTYAPIAGATDDTSDADATVGANGGTLSGDSISFLTVRRLSKRMGHDLLLAAFAKVLDRYPGARLFVAGDGPLRDDLERRAVELGVDDRTTFLGYVPDEELPAAYATADAFVLPTTELEGFGLATLEALSSGTPVVGTPVGGTVEVLGSLVDRPSVPDELLLSSVDASELAGGMGVLADLDAAALQSLGRTCRRYAREQYTWDRTVTRLEAYYLAGG
ncbi:glycosyltransferase family 4 protein [Natronoarchaeum mannanilyticum]|uniref:Glycosyltransferase family 4 protein n=1 Tax=Natronoarchaeum mannanilyticum TaxID=926360 RepID=A0AAV3TED2_9EURY